MCKRLLSVGDFAKRSRVTLATLHHYDKIGLLSPVSRGDNSYRYYSLGQLSEVNLIRALQELGMPLCEIKGLKERRTPDGVIALLREQIEKIKEKINGWRDAQKLITTLLNAIISVQNADERALSIQFLPEAPIMLGGWNEYGEGEDGYDALVKFYADMSAKYPEVNITYPVWGIFTEENLKIKMRGQHTWPERYYFYMADGPDKRPAGFYAVGYARGGYGQNDGLYVRMRDYIEQNGFSVAGDGYEEYPLNEICIADADNYLMRVLIPVRKNGA